jgi:hypothetical protein
MVGNFSGTTGTAGATGTGAASSTGRLAPVTTLSATGSAGIKHAAGKPLIDLGTAALGATDLVFFLNGHKLGKLVLASRANEIVGWHSLRRLLSRVSAISIPQPKPAAHPPPGKPNRPGVHEVLP